MYEAVMGLDGNFHSVPVAEAEEKCNEIIAIMEQLCQILHDDEVSALLKGSLTTFCGMVASALPHQKEGIRTALTSTVYNLHNELKVLVDLGVGDGIISDLNKWCEGILSWSA